MSATTVRERRQTTLPQEVVEAARLRIGDQVDWRFEDGEIKGRKLVPESRGSEVLESKDVDPKTLLPRTGEIETESLLTSLHTGRER